MAKRLITRQRQGGGFSYYEGGEPVRDQDTLRRIKELAIPPAWHEVTISPRRTAKVLAQGRDDAGRLQKIYNPTFRARQERQKYSRILQFAAKLTTLRRQVERDLARPELSKNKVLACIVKLIDEAYFRVGNEQYARENQSYGITTMRRKHVEVSGYTVTFDFTGKSGQHHVKKITDRALARIVKELDEMPGYEIFRYEDEDGKLHNVSAGDVNDYIRRLMGEEFSAKDFRTWGGTLLAVELLATGERLRAVAERKQAVSACIKQVASRLGNTPAIARASYIDPQIFKRYMGGDNFSAIRQTIAGMRPHKYLSADERCALKILQK